MFESDATNATAAAAQNMLAELESTTDQFSDFVERFGRSEVNGAINNILGTTFGDLVMQVINESDLPDFVKDAAEEAINGAVADERQVTTPEAEAATQDELGDAMDDLMEGMVRAADEMMSEEAEGGSETSGAKSKAGAAGNWLVALAKALGDVAGQHLGKSVEYANEISALAESGGDNAERAQEMTGLQAQMQAETQMFKLAQEAVTTIVKSVGEALQSTARKQ